MIATKSEGSVRERLLAAANELFYAEGIHTVGIERVLERAGVAKASLYGTFGSKDELVRAYLEERGRSIRERIMNRIAQYPNPKDRILAVFDVLGEVAQERSYRGCAFVNACAEGPSGPSPARDAATSQREWRRGLLSRLAGELGVPDPAAVGQQLSLLYDGALIGSYMDSDPTAAQTARRVAERLLDEKSAAPKTAPKRKKKTPARRRKTK